ncbi:uncharacterized protein LOC129613082 [Condylostylus longicornis]|uniref:uncharacterized protein LOC129613082 n=1 Tax=Condylostylus longicornis TaxID=2530218 RepID=UPI00244DD6D9|nr:uncharacterized protein LOC129613082 [Condylostylus longicornis]
MDGQNTTDNDNCDSEDVPKWINKDYLELVLKDYFKDNLIKILDFYTKLATKKGENYASLVIRVVIEYENKNLKYNIGKYIIKSSIEDDPITKKVIKEYQAFEDEMLMYGEALPKIQELMNTQNNLQEISVFPKPIYCDFKNNAIILEDLLQRGYKGADRLKGLDEQHAKLALKKLAIFHACSIILDQQDPGCFKKFDHGIYNRHSDGLNTFFCSSLHKICTTLHNFGDEFINYSKKIRNLIPHWVEKERQCYDPKPNQLNVLAHGDFWSTNIMFKYDEFDQDDESRKPLDAILIDFQFSIWASPAIDLHYFFNTSLAGLPNIDEMENYVKYYYHELLETLKLFEFKEYSKIPNFKEFLQEFWENGFHALQTAFIHKSIAFLEDSSVACPEALFCEGDKMENFEWAMINNKRIQEHWKILLPCFERKGLFDL